MEAITALHAQLAITTLQSVLLTYFLTPLMLCVLILYISGGTYSLRSIPNDRFLRNFIMAILLTRRVLEICWKEITEEIPSVFCFDVWPGFTSNKATHYLLDHGDYYFIVFPNYEVFWYSQNRKLLESSTIALNLDCGYGKCKQTSHPSSHIKYVSEL